VTHDPTGAPPPQGADRCPIRPRQRWAADDGREAHILLVRSDGVVLRDSFGWQHTMDAVELRTRWRLLAE